MLSFLCVCVCVTNDHNNVGNINIIDISTDYETGNITSGSRDSEQPELITSAKLYI